MSLPSEYGLSVSRSLFTILYHLCISFYPGLSVTSYPVVAKSSMMYFIRVLHYTESLFGSCSMQSRHASEVLLQLWLSVCCNISSCYMPYAMTHLLKHTLKMVGLLAGDLGGCGPAPSNSISHSCHVIICFIHSIIIFAMVSKYKYNLYNYGLLWLKPKLCT